MSSYHSYLSKLLIKVQSKTKIFLKGMPFFYLIVYRIRKLFNKPACDICTTKTDLCIEAYPSSANSYLCNLIKALNREIDIAHHTHSIANIKLAFRYNVPVVVIIRNPIEAISSRIARFGLNIDYSICEYILFYNFIVKNKTKVLCINFNDVTDNIENVLYRIRKIIHSDLKIDRLNEAQKTAFSEITNFSRQKGKLFRKPLPSKEREIKKEQIK